MKWGVLACALLLCSVMRVNANPTNDAGRQLAAEMLNTHIKPSTSTAAVTTLLQGLGVSSQTIGAPSSDQVADMGVAGTTFASFSFRVKPACDHGTQRRLGLNGTALSIACQSPGSTVILNACIANATVAHCQRVTIPLPTNGTSIDAHGYGWTATCNATGHCQGQMQHRLQITANSDSLPDAGRAAQQHNAAYQAIYATYAGKSGYNRTQAYMASFADNGSNNWLSKCTTGMSGYLQQGQYYSCDKTQQGDLNRNCVSVKTCTHYTRHEKTTVTHPMCTLTATEKSVTCKRWPDVTVKTLPFPAPVPQPCTHIVNASPRGASTAPGPNADNACYVPGSFRVEHDRDQHGTSAMSAIAGGEYYFYAVAWYYNSHGYADLFVQVGGKTLARVQAHSNAGYRHVALLALKNEHVILNGYNHGFDDSDYNAAYSAYWAAAPAHQTHKVATVTWKETCGGLA